MTTLKIKLNTYRPTKSGRYPLDIQLIHRRERCLLPTGIKIGPEYFDRKRNSVRYVKGGCYSRHEIHKMNLILHGEMESIQDRICQYHAPEEYTANDVSQWYKRRKDMKNVFSYLEQMMEDKEKINKYGTASAYRSTFNSLRRYCHGEKLYFSEIDYRFLNGYDNHLQGLGDTANTVAYYMRNLRTAYNQALDDHIFPYPTYGSPFRRITAAATETSKRALSATQLKNVASVDTHQDSALEFARDMFMASFYMRGIPFVDMINLTSANIFGDTIVYNRRKTAARVVVEIVPQLKSIISRYQTGDGYLFLYAPKRNDKECISYKDYRSALRRYNRHLIKIGTLAGLDVVLTGYVARHTWATLAKKKGIPTAVISEGLGHSSERITQVYLKSFGNEILDEANKLVSII